jgi:hypothetical protein
VQTVNQNAAAYLGEVGITLDFIGWADTFTFDREVQEAVNRRYVASQDQAIAALLAPYAATIRTLAEGTRCVHSVRKPMAGCRAPSSDCRRSLVR